MGSVIEKVLIKVAAFNRAAKPSLKDAHPFLTGIHTPIQTEFSIEDLRVRGTIPSQLDGLYVRNGPNPVQQPKESCYHWFLGDGMVHGVQLKNGLASWYKNRWVRSYSVSEALGEIPVEGARNELVDTVNTNIIGFAGKLWALVEGGGCPVELDSDLNTVRHNAFDGSRRGFSAHPHCDRSSEGLHAICYSVKNRAELTHVVVGSDGRVVNEASIPVGDGPSVHDCAITDKYVLIFDLPVVFSVKKLLSGFLFPYEWSPNRTARVGLLDRHSKEPKEPKWFEVEPCYVFHPCNAYENDQGDVIVDVCSHDSMFASSNFGPDSKTIRFERWMLDEKTSKVSRKVIDENPQEFPRFDERLTGKYYRYAYSVSLESSESSGSSVIKHDFESGQKEIHDFGMGRVPGEFVFVPKSSTSKEDEGWLLGFVIDVAQKVTDLVILDGENFRGSPIAEIRIPHVIPPGFHGNWIPSSPVKSRL